MDIIYEKLSQRCTSDRRVMQFTVDQDFNVPDHLGDISELVSSSSILSVSETKVTGDRLYVRGGLCFQMLYYSEDNERSLSGFDGFIDFDEIVRINSEAEGSWCVNAVLEDMKISIIHPRKISVTGLVTLNAECRLDRAAEVVSGIVGADFVEVLTEEGTNFSLLYSGQEQISLNDSLGIENSFPNIRKILFSLASLTDFDQVLQNASIKLFGKLKLFVIYESEEDCTPTFYNGELLFEKDIAIEGANDSCSCSCIPSLNQIKIEAGPDEENEPRRLIISGKISSDTEVYSEKHLNYLKDAYATSGVLLNDTAEIKSMKILDTIKEIFKISQNITPDIDIRQANILFCKSDIIAPDTKICDTGIQIFGCVEVTFYFSDSSDSQKLHQNKLSIDFSENISVMGLDSLKPEDISVNFSLLPLNTQVRLLPSGEVEIRTDIRLNGLIYAEESGEYITDISHNECCEKCRKQITCYFVQPGDTAFEIGKKYKLKPDDIEILNPGVEMKPGNRIYMYTCRTEGEFNNEKLQS
jgi:hypothetical protein